MSIDLNRTSQIAFLKITDSQKESIGKTIEKEIAAMDAIKDLEGIKPTTKISNAIQYRADEPWEPSNRDDLLRNAKGSAQGCFSVPKIVE